MGSNCNSRITVPGIKNIKFCKYSLCYIMYLVVSD
jgi:hypothetical protein